MTRPAIILLLLGLAEITSFTTKVNYIKRKCGSTLMISTAERIILEYGDDPVEEDCQIKLEAYDPINNFDNINLHLRFLDLELSCTQASVVIDKFDTSNEIYGARRKFVHSGIGETVCGDEIPDKIYESNLKKMAINFHKKVSHIDDAYVDILVTKVNNGLCDENKEFECDSGRCVDETLVCDDYYNCDDESDEFAECFFTPGAITGITIALIVIIALVLLAVIFIPRKRKYGTFFKKKSEKPVATIHPNSQPYFASSTSSLAKQLTPVYAPSLAPSMTPNLTPESQKRAWGSTFHQSNGPQRDFGLKKLQSVDEKYQESELEDPPEKNERADRSQENRDRRNSKSHDRRDASPHDSSDNYDRIDQNHEEEGESRNRYNDSRRNSRDRHHDSSLDRSNDKAYHSPDRRNSKSRDRRDDRQRETRNRRHQSPSDSPDPRNYSWRDSRDRRNYSSRDSRDRADDSFDQHSESPRESRTRRHENESYSRDRRYDNRRGSRDRRERSRYDSRDRSFDRSEDSFDQRHDSPRDSRDNRYDSSRDRHHDNSNDDTDRPTRRGSKSRHGSRDRRRLDGPRKTSDHRGGSGSRRSSASDQSVNKSPSINTDV